jgi:hypothetical protein
MCGVDHLLPVGNKLFRFFLDENSKYRRDRSLLLNRNAPSEFRTR